MGLDQLAAAEHLDQRGVRAHLDALPDQLPGHRVQPAGHLDVQVPGHLRGGEDRHVVGTARRRQQQGRLGGGEVLGRSGRGGAVHPQPGRGATPGEHPALRVGQVGEVLTAEEALPDVLHGALHPRLVLGVAHPGRVGAEPAGLGVVEPADGEPGVDRVGIGHDRGHVVRDEHREDASEVAPGRFTPIDHRRQGLGEGQPDEHVPGVDRGEDQPVHRPSTLRLRVEHQPQPAEVELALHPGRTVGDPQRRLPPAEPAALHREAVQGPVRHLDAAPSQLAVDVGQRQIRRHPGRDLLGPRPERLPRRPVPRGPGRAHRGHHHADQLVGQLPWATGAGQPGRLGGLDVAAGRLTVHPGPLSRRPQPRPREPCPQHFGNLDHPNLPERHPNPPRHWT